MMIHYYQNLIKLNIVGLTQWDWQSVHMADHSKWNFLTKLGGNNPPMGLLKNPEFFWIWSTGGRFGQWVHFRPQNQAQNTKTTTTSTKITQFQNFFFRIFTWWLNFKKLYQNFQEIFIMVYFCWRFGEI